MVCRMQRDVNDVSIVHRNVDDCPCQHYPPPHRLAACPLAMCVSVPMSTPKRGVKGGISACVCVTYQRERSCSSIIRRTSAAGLAHHCAMLLSLCLTALQRVVNDL